jgi:O-antigen/teichoic acid export membrane protein/glycosyltransferase involved in cell wall biosynthesis
VAEPAVRRLRILFYVEGLDIGGANQSTTTTAVALKRRGHEVFYASADGPLRKRLEDAGIPHLLVNTRVAHPNRAAARRLAETLDREKIDLVCPNGWDCLMDALLATISRGIPVVPTFPSIYPRYAHPRVPRAIVYSGEYRDALIRRYRWKAGSLEMFINRIDTDRFRPGLDGSGFRSRWEIPQGAPIVLMACRLDALKIEGIHFLLNAVPALVREAADVRVLLVGDGEYREDLDRKVDDLNREAGYAAVIATGKVLEVEQAFAAADVVVGNGARSGLEGMACGKPVVSVGPSGLAGIFTPENIEDFAYHNFDKGRVFDGLIRKDPEALAETVALLLGDEARRRSLGEFGREFVVRRLGIEAGLARLEEIYLGAERRAPLQRIRDGYEFGRSYLSFTLYRAQHKLRRLLTRRSSGLAPASDRSSGTEGGFLRNSATTFLTTIFCLGVGTVQAAVVARVLKPEGKGAYTAAMLLPLLFGTFLPLGINWASTYYVGRKAFDREALFRTMIAALILLGGAGMLLCLAAGLLLRGPLLEGVPASAFLLGILTIPTSIAILFLYGLFRGEMRISESNRMHASRAALMLLCTLFFLLVLGLGVAGVVLGQVSAETMVVVMAFRRLGGIAPRPLFRWDILRTLLGYGIQLYSFTILIYLNYRFDMFLVRSMLDLRQTGLYSTAVALAEMLWMVPNSMGVVLFPSVARSSGPERDHLTLAVCRNTLWIMLVLCGAVALGRNLIIHVFFGRQFLPAAPALLAILPGILAMSVQQVLGAHLGGRGHPLPGTLAAGLGFAANVVLNFLWIPRYGIVGASLASSISYTLVAVMVAVAFLRISRTRARDAFIPRKEDWSRIVGIFHRLKGAAA